MCSYIKFQMKNDYPTRIVFEYRRGDVHIIIITIISSLSNHSIRFVSRQKVSQIEEEEKKIESLSKLDRVG